MKTTGNPGGAMPLEIVVLSSGGEFLKRVLDALRRADMTVSATFVQGYGGAKTDSASLHAPEIPLAKPAAPEPLAGHDTEFIGDIAGDAAYALLDECEPDVIVTACYAQILPGRVLALPRLGCINLHPSLLPAFRGPSPLFWQFHAGVPATGITVHRTTAVIDGGDILAQQSLPLPAGVSVGQINRTLGDLGGELLVDVLARLAGDGCAGEPQDAASASYQSWPGDDAFVLDPGWTAERAYRFMRGTREWGLVYWVVSEDTVLRLEDVLSFEVRGGIDQAWIEEAGRLVVRFADGVVVGVGEVVSG